MPAQKKSKPALKKKSKAKSQKDNRWEKVIKDTTRSLRGKVSPSKQIELLEKRAAACKALGKLEAQAADIEKIADLQKALIAEGAQANRQSQAELEILTSIAQAVVDQVDYQRIGQIVGERIQKFFNAEIAAVGLYDQEAGIISVPYYYERGVLKDVPSYEYGQGVSSYALKTRKPIYIATAKEAEKYGVIYTEEFPAETMLMSPILSGKKALGVLSLQHSKQHAYGKHELQILSAIANSMAVALENARLFDETQKSHREISEALAQQTATSDILRTLASSPADIKPVLHAVAQHAADLTEANDVQIYQVDGDQLRQITHFGPLPALQDGEALPLVPGLVAGRVVLERRTIHLEDAKKLSREEYPESVKLQRRLGHRTTLGVPLIRDEQAIGLIVVRRNVVRPFTENQISLLKTFADQAAIAIEKARLLNETNRLLEETTQRNAELAVINSVQQGLSSSLKFQEIVDLVGEKVREIFKADTVLAFMYDAPRDWSSNIYYVDRGRRMTAPDGPKVRPSLTAIVVDTRQPLLIETREQGRKLGSVARPPAGAKEDQNESGLYVPILAGENVIGVVSVQSYQPKAYGLDDLRLLQTLAGSMSVALENARLFDETAQRNAELAVINSIQDGLSRSLKLQEIVDLVGEKVGEVFRADTVVAVLYDPERDWGYSTYYVDRGRRVQIPDSPMPRPSLFAAVVDSRKPLLIGTNEESEKLGAIKRPPSETEEDKNESILFVPIIAIEKVIGAVSVQSYKQHAYRINDLRLLQTIAASMSVALENARLFDETTQRNAELAVINSVQEGLSRSLNLQEIVDLVGKKVGEIFQADTVFAGLYDEARDWGSHIYYVDGDKRVPVPDGPVIRPSLAAYVADTKKSLLLGTKQEGAKLGAVRVVRRKGEEDRNESVLGVPIMKGESVIGGISVQSYKPNAYTQGDLRLLETLASSMSVALQNAQLFDETTQRNAELAVINSVQDGLSQSLDLQQIVDLVGEKIGEIFQADTVSAGLYDAERDWGSHIYYVDRGRRLPIPDGPTLRPSLTAHVLDTMKSIHLGTLEESEAMGAVRNPPSEGEPDQNESILLVPILAGEKVIGAISVQSYKRNAYSKDDLRLLQTLAGSMSVALENARLFDETTQRNAELAVINSVQQGLAGSLKLQEIIDLVGEKVGQIFNADTVMAAMYDSERNWGFNAYYADRGRRIQNDSLSDGPVTRPSLFALVVDSGQPLLIATKEESQKLGSIQQPLSETEEDQNESILFVPILAGEKVIGVVSVQSYQQNAYGEQDLRLLQTLAASMSVALQNAQLFDETAQRNAELAVINSVQEAMAKQLDIKAIYEAVGEKVKDIFNAQAVILGGFDQVAEKVIPYYFYEKGERYFPEPWAFSGLITELIARQKTIVINERFEEKVKEYGMISVAGSETSKSGIFVPLVTGGKVVGGITLQNIDRENAFSDSDVRLLETLANSMSVALENARLFDETAQRNAELSIINAVQEGLASKLEIESIIDLVGGKLGEIFPDMDAIQINLYDQVNDLIHIPYCVEKGLRHEHESRKPWGIRKLVLASRQAVVDNGPQDDDRLREMAEKFDVGEMANPLIAGEMPKSVLFVPLLVGDQVRGIISLQNMTRENAFSDSTVQLLSTLANSMSVALENARLFDETERLLKVSEQRAAELAVINSVQASLAEELDFQGIYDAVGEKLCEVFNTGVGIYSYDLEANTRTYVFSFVDGERQPFITEPINDLHEYFLSQNKVLFSNDFHNFVKQFSATPPFGVFPKSMVWVPLPRKGNQVTAITLVDNNKENAFKDSDIRLLETLASSMSVALENARLFIESNRLLDESRKKEEELSTVNTVSQAVASELELASLIELIGVQVRKIFKADIAYLALLNEGKRLIEFPYIFGDTLQPLKLGEGIVSQVIQGGKPVLINRDEDWKETEQKIARVGTRALSYLGVPILAGKHAIGAISVQSTQKAGRFADADVHLLSTIAANVGAAIENARLFAEVARQKEYFETFFQYSPAAVVVVDFNGTVISWNPAAQTLFGYTAEEAIGRDVDSLVASDPRVETEARMYTNKFTKELGRVEVKGQRTRKDGSLVDVEVKGLPIAVEGKMVGLLVIYHDISEIEQARRAAEEANQAKSAFLANMSHELRTPLNAIIGFTRIVRRKGEEALPDKQLENLDKVLVSAEHLLGLINTILDIAKIEAGRMELQLSDFNLSALVDGCLATTQPLMKPGVQLFSTLPQRLPQMHSDEEKIRQVLLNLLSNAAKFTHEGSIQVTGELKGDQISLAVKDSGIGIAPEDLGKIFEEFQQADTTTTREYGGTGLGLSISRSLAKLLGGDLTVASVEGQGSTFTLTLPMRLGPTAAVSVDGKDEMAEPSLDPDKPIVLVIDDQPDMFHILQQNLGDAGYQVVGALSGEEGIEKARSLHPFAITLDIMMPRKDGWQVLYELKNDPETKNIPVIILTIVDNKPMGFRLGASDYLVKPLSERSVLDALERLAKSNGGIRPRKLLVVDDDPKVVDMVHQMLEGEGFAIESAADGVEALSHLEGSQPDVILLDLLMPRMDGFQFINELRKQTPLRAIPIIVLTAKSLSNEESAQLEKSVAKIVQKQGLGSETLIKEIHHIVSRPAETK